jgi:hypothetical protein
MKQPVRNIWSANLDEFTDENDFVYGITAFIAKIEGCEPCEVVPKTNFVDLECLDKYLTCSGTGAAARFDAGDYTISATADGELEARPKI